MKKINKKECLTNEEDEYAYGLASGYSQVKAYKEAFKPKKSDRCIILVASNLAKTKKIKDRVAEYSLLVTNKKVMDFNETCELLTAYARDKTDKNASLKALTAIINLFGFNAPTKVETKNETNIKGSVIDITYEDAETMKLKNENS